MQRLSELPEFLGGKAGRCPKVLDPWCFTQNLIEGAQCLVACS